MQEVVIKALFDTNTLGVVSYVRVLAAYLERSGQSLADQLQSGDAVYPGNAFPRGVSVEVTLRDVPEASITQAGRIRDIIP